MSLKKGDLVEVIDSVSYPEFIGYRYTLVDSETGVLSKAQDIFHKGIVWESPFIDEGLIVCFMEAHLRKVNPDGDEVSDESFESLMTKLKASTKRVSIKTKEKKYYDCTK